MLRFLLIISLLFVSLITATENSKQEVILLHTNDIESVYEPIPALWRDDMDYIGGLSHLATLIRDVREEEGITFLLDAGDIFTGALSKKTEGELPFDLYSAMDYDAMTLGNHEFEYGWEILVDTIPRANFPVLNANIYNETTGKLIAKPYTILVRKGVKVGVIGVMGIDAFYNTMAPFHRTGLSVKDPTETAQYWADKIRADVDMIVVLTHQNKTAPMQTNKEADLSVQRGFDEDYAMAGALRGVDVIFGGHSDNGLNEPVIHPKTGTVIGLTFGQGMHLGYTKFAVDLEKHNVDYLDGYLIPVNSAQLPEDKKTAQLIKDSRNNFPELAEVIAKVEQPLMRRYNKESSIGNLLTDFMKSAGNSDIGFLNSGAIRADMNAGNLTLEQLINIYPFKDNLTVIELSGQQVRDLVEYSLTLPYGIGQVSGLSITYDSSKKMMKRLVDLKVNGEKIIDAKKYTVAVSGYLADGGDGFIVFTEGRVVNANLPFQDALYSQFKKAKNIKKLAIGRQIDISEK